MSGGHDDGGVTDQYGFRVVRRGYDRAAVDAFAHQAHAEITDLRRRYETLAAHYAELQSAKPAPPPAETDFSSLGGRAQEILRIAEEQARELTAEAAADSDRLAEQTEMELRMLREHAEAELEQVRAAELDRLAGLRRQAEHEAGVRLAAAEAEAEQLQAAARLAAAAVRTEAEGDARATLESAQLRASGVLADAEREALVLRQSAAEQRDRVLAELKAEADELRGRIEQTLAEATRMQRESAEHLAAEAAEAARVRAAAVAEADRIRLAATEEAEQVVARAQQQAATVEERSRQEFAWRRRQLRTEQDLLTRRKQAMLGQLASLSALAVETADSLPEVPDLALSDVAGETGVSDDRPEVRGAGSEDQNNRSSTLSIPRSTS